MAHIGELSFRLAFTCSEGHPRNTSERNQTDKQTNYTNNVNTPRTIIMIYKYFLNRAIDSLKCLFSLSSLTYISRQDFVLSFVNFALINRVLHYQFVQNVSCSLTKMFLFSFVVTLFSDKSNEEKKLGRCTRWISNKWN